MVESGVALGRKEPHTDRCPGGKRSRQWGWLLAGSGLLLVTLTVLPFAYWKVVNAVPVVPRPPAPPVHQNGLVQAIAALNAIPAAAYGGREPDRARYPRVAPLLNDTRAALKREWSVWRPTGAPLDPGHVPALARFLSLESRVRRERGDLSGALSSALDAFELGLKVSEAGGLGARYSGWSCAEMGLAEAEQLVSELPVEVVEQHLPRVRRLRAAWPEVADIVARERDLAVDGCRVTLLNVARMDLWSQLDSVEAGVIIWGSFHNRPRLHSDWKVWQQALTPHDVALREVDGYYRRLEAGLRQRGSSTAAPSAAVSNNVWARGFCTPPVSMLQDGEWPVLSLALLETSMAVRAEALARGRTPRTLAEISRDRLPEVPRDLWGQPILLRIRSGKPTVYSQGPDKKDHRGSAVPRQAGMTGTKGDLVFGRLAERAWRKR